MTFESEGAAAARGCEAEAEGAETAASISWAAAKGATPEQAVAAAAARKRPAVASLPRPLRALRARREGRGG